MRIEMEPTINAERYGMEHDEEEDTKDGQSATQVCLLLLEKYL